MSRYFSRPNEDYVVGDAEYVATTQMAVSVWLKLDPDAVFDRGEIASTEPGSAAGWITTVLFAGTTAAGVFNGSFPVVLGATTLADSVWIHFLFTHDTINDRLRIYINGVQDGETTGVVAPLSSGINLQIGRRENDTRYYYGFMAFFAIFDFVPDATQIATLQTQKPTAIGTPTVYLFDNIDDVINYGSNSIEFTDVGTAYSTDTPIADSTPVIYVSSCYPDIVPAIKYKHEYGISRIESLAPPALLDFFGFYALDFIQRQEIFDYGISIIDPSVPVTPSTFYSYLGLDVPYKIREYQDTGLIILEPIVVPTLIKDFDFIGPDIIFKKQDRAIFPSSTIIFRAPLPPTPSKKSIIELYNLTVRLDVKQITDSGSAFADSTDVGGTTVLFNKVFKSIDSVVATTQEVQDFVTVVDFVGVPNPTFFKVYVFNTAGVRVSKNIYWVARGIS